MNSTESSQKQLQESIESEAKRAALSRWKLETLTGLLGFRALSQHQSETARNMAAENQAVRRKFWGSQEAETGDSMRGDIVLGDNVVHPPQVVLAGQGSGFGQLLGAAAIGASMLGIPAAGVAGYLLSRSQAVTPASTSNDPDSETVNLGLLRIDQIQREGASR